MASIANRMVGGRGINCHFNLGNSVTKFYIYVVILISYDDMINMDWWESHDAILNGKTKLLS
jgi:hypothetical protein